MLFGCGMEVWSQKNFGAFCVVCVCVCVCVVHMLVMVTKVCVCVCVHVCPLPILYGVPIIVCTVLCIQVYTFNKLERCF